MELLILVVFWSTLLVIGFVFGRAAERRHYRSIVSREKQLLHIPTTASRVPVTDTPVERCELVSGSVVVSADYFKRAVALLRGLVGGPIGSYETLLDRARREAILRLKERCPKADEIVNLRLETTPLDKNPNGGVGSVDVFVYGTALYYVKHTGS